MGWFKRLPRIVRDLIIFNSFIFMIQFIMNYGLRREFAIQSSSLMAANVGIMIVYLFRYRVEKVRAEERAEKNKSKKN
ncbi:MAG: hypothetical protein RIN55_09740 [Tissierellaceae bacterium]|nr:hypothetical protein [Tissierellaceae bacterium]